MPLVVIVSTKRDQVLQRIFAEPTATLKSLPKGFSHGEKCQGRISRVGVFETLPWEGNRGFLPAPSVTFAGDSRRKA
jgi:hypothetical protein